MSVFRCDKCGCYGNTALGRFWWRLTVQKLKERLCHACLYDKFPENKQYEKEYKEFGRFDKCPEDFVDETLDIKIT